jgi:hypothetical protein
LKSANQVTRNWAENIARKRVFGNLNDVPAVPAAMENGGPEIGSQEENNTEALNVNTPPIE